MILHTAIPYTPYYKAMVENYFKDHYDVTITSECGEHEGALAWICVMFNNTADCTAYTLKHGYRREITTEQMRKL